MVCAFKPLLCLTLAVSAVACSTTPKLDTGNVTSERTPREMSQGGAPQTPRVHWGGLILSSENQSDRTVLEVLSYPLTREGRPDRDAEPQGRFLVERAGYLETADYDSGRLLSVVGTVQRIESATVGAAPYRYPVVEADQLHLWSRPGTGGAGNSNVHFGIGVGVIFD